MFEISYNSASLPHPLADKTTEDVEVIDDWEEEEYEVEAKVVSLSHSSSSSSS
ncbi:hypothetical protein F2Q70_00015723 [Brassica cretica]|uniref:Uncharacterized protein n=1 Tax=Brassica cretica TaxID=69181 RepID=A0A8S9HVN7_BRACR|nr:hypothetical protein F2Q70_00015723 [Brassica cretica]